MTIPAVIWKMMPDGVMRYQAVRYLDTHTAQEAAARFICSAVGTQIPGRAPEARGVGQALIKLDEMFERKGDEFVAKTDSIIGRLHFGVWPVNACLRWNTRADVTIESGLTENEYAHEVANIQNDGCYGWDFDKTMTVPEIEEALDYICANCGKEA